MGMDMPPIGERNIKTEPFSIKDVLLTLIEAVPGIEVIIVDDRQEIIKGFIGSYTYPESYCSVYIHNGDELHVRRKSGLTEVMSRICDAVSSELISHSL